MRLGRAIRLRILRTRRVIRYLPIRLLLALLVPLIAKVLNEAKPSDLLDAVSHIKEKE
jgi:hypothetical protein